MTAPEPTGATVTLKLFEDNSLVRDAVDQPGADRVLVIVTHRPLI